MLGKRIKLHQVAKLAEIEIAGLVHLNAGPNPAMPLIEKDQAVLGPTVAAKKLNRKAGRKSTDPLPEPPQESKDGLVDRDVDSGSASSLWIKERLAYHAQQAQERVRSSPRQ
jgi:hypothetical protein